MVLDFSFLQIMKSARNGYFLKFGMGVCCLKVVNLSLHPRPDPAQLQFCNFVLNYAPKVLSCITGGLFGRPSGGKKLRKGARSACERGNTAFVTSGFPPIPDQTVQKLYPLQLSINFN